MCLCPCPQSSEAQSPFPSTQQDRFHKYALLPRHRRRTGWLPRPRRQHGCSSKAHKLIYILADSLSPAFANHTHENVSLLKNGKNPKTVCKHPAPHAGHIRDIIMNNKVMQFVEMWINKHSNTITVFAANHECGGCMLNGYNPLPLKSVTMSIEESWRLWSAYGGTVRRS
ncbi:uncharacterized protein B0I36DRAFT_117331 [Microdochium trichocladiopsis]|uniref:Uncharacterized protein n=1 Tax=Microdochium trichocladiopsis TaxID=1682393 RepID=A0A9P8Y900_9PEZI|nr:uncharacterized protein B0I36DRAFT_117331 [Microdochium trichocladiopsis]KAH7030989.1 hypothetical protein B0I36DRAFT_117331 [Microdochium trichocladiopsis]